MCDSRQQADNIRIVFLVLNIQVEEIMRAAIKQLINLLSKE